MELVSKENIFVYHSNDFWNIFRVCLNFNETVNSFSLTFEYLTKLESSLQVQSAGSLPFPFLFFRLALMFSINLIEPLIEPSLERKSYLNHTNPNLMTCSRTNVGNSYLFKLSLKLKSANWSKENFPSFSCEICVISLLESSKCS